MSPSITRGLAQRKRRILQRLQPRPGVEHARPMLGASNIHYELAQRTSAIAAGGLGAIHLMVQKLGLARDINANLQVFKRHLPYHESDHVLNIAYNILAGGQRIEHLEWLRNNEAYLDALGAERIPDPTTAVDFCRRFHRGDILDLMDAINQTRLRVWAQQPQAFFDQATIDVPVRVGHSAAEGGEAKIRSSEEQATGRGTGCGETLSPGWLPCSGNRALILRLF